MILVITHEMITVDKIDIVDKETECYVGNMLFLRSLNITHVQSLDK